MSNDRAKPPTEWQRRISRAVAESTQTPRSGITMCHRQGKTAVYLSKDKTHIVEHPPHGPIRHIPLEPFERQ